MANVLIIFGSTSGNTQLVAEKVGMVLEDAKHNVTIQRVEQSDVNDMKKPDVVILGASTYGHGILQDHFIPFREAMRSFDLNGQKCAVIGLGDPKYDAQYHMEAAPILEEAVKESGGNLLQPTLKVSGSPVRALDTYILKWAEDFAKKI